jgi:hypothetical protein
VTIDPNVALARSSPEGEAEYRALITELRELWPDLEPIPGQPRLSRFDVKNGVWFIGHSDDHAETGTYRTYRVFRQMFVPLIFLGAYRVYETRRGSVVFIGRHPLPMWAQMWNAVGIPVVCLLVYLIAMGITEPLR